MEYTRFVDCELVKENEDGSAVYTFNFTAEEREMLMRLGIVAALKAGIEEAQKLHPDYVEKDVKENGNDY